MKILVDAMGGDNAPLCVLQGVSQAAARADRGTNRKVRVQIDPACVSVP